MEKSSLESQILVLLELVRKQREALNTLTTWVRGYDKALLDQAGGLDYVTKAESVAADELPASAEQLRREFEDRERSVGAEEMRKWIWNNPWAGLRDCNAAAIVEQLRKETQG